MSDKEIKVVDPQETVEVVAVGEVVPDVKTPSSKVTRRTKFNVQIIVLFLIFLCILSLFGGETLGNWYTTTQETDRDGYTFSSGQAKYSIDAMFLLGQINGEVIVENETSEMKYGDLECNCDKTKSVMLGIKILVSLNLLAGMAIIYFIRYQKFNEDMITKLLFAIIVISLVATIYFATALPNAINEDQGQASIYSIQEKDPSFISTYSEVSSTDRELNDFFDVTIRAQWHPDLGFLYLISNLLLCFLALGILNYDFSKIFGSLD
ncbi:MAG: hypothetical protein VX898_02410 [Candidatus Thermoplasmatota archaeon]|nr:hypothetical protein [Candidatus Thermoplasmatota archaeon]